MGPGPPPCPVTERPFELDTNETIGQEQEPLLCEWRAEGGTDLALDDLPEKHPARAELEEVQRTAERAARLTRQLLALSRSHVPPPAPLDAATVLSNMRPLLSRLTGPRIGLKFQVSPDCPKVAIDTTHLEQLLTNYVVNGRDALPTGGTIVIGLGPHLVATKEHEQPVPGLYLELTVTDEGTGIPKEALPRLFEPFFTTKKQGTGLGLATCHAIVSQLGGTIAMMPRKGGGKQVRTLLPAHNAPSRLAPRPIPAPPVVPCMCSWSMTKCRCVR